MVTRRERVRDQNRSSPEGRQFEDGSPGAGQGQIARRNTVTHVRLVLEQGVTVSMGGPVQPVAEAGVISRTGNMNDIELPAGPFGQRLDRSLIDAAGSLASPHHQQATRFICNSETGSGALPVSLEDGPAYGAAGHPDFRPAQLLDLESQADPVGPPGEKPVGQAEMPVRLGQHQRELQGAGRDAGRTGDEPATAQHHIRTPVPDQFPGPRDRGGRLGYCPGCFQGIPPVDPGKVKQVNLVPGPRDQLRFEPAASTEERHLGPFISKLVGYG